MGVDIFPSGAQWSYMGFAAFRKKLAQADGIDLKQMYGYVANGKSWTGFDGENITPLAPLLNHSDCDGFLQPYECEEVLPRLNQIISTWPDTDLDKSSAQLLIEGMEHCVEHRCAMRFC